MKNNKYLAELYESCRGKEIEHGLALLLKSWKRQVDCGSDHIYITGYNCFLDNKFVQEDIEDFVYHIKKAGIESFTVELDAIAPEALHHFFLFSANSDIVKTYHHQPKYELNAWCGSNGSRWYTITILR